MITSVYIGVDLDLDLGHALDTLVSDSSKSNSGRA